MPIETTFVLCWLACALTCAWLAARKGYRTRDWFWLGCGLGFIALLLLLFQPTRDSLDASDPDPR